MSANYMLQRASVLLVLLVLFASTFTTVSGALRQYNFRIHSGTAAPDGVSRPVYLINDQQPGPLIEVEEGDDLKVFVQNDLSVENTLHWHGLLQRGTPQMDGSPGVAQSPIPAGANFTYRFSVGSEYGFYWYHSHFRAYYDDAIQGPLLIHPAASRTRPFESLASADAKVKQALLDAERNATNVMLADWTHDTSDIIYGRYFETGAFPHCVDSLLANGMGRVQCLPENVLMAGVGLGLGGESMSQGGLQAISGASSSMQSAMSKSTGSPTTTMSSMTESMSMMSMPMPSSSMSRMKKRMDMSGSSMSGMDVAMTSSSSSVMDMGSISPSMTTSMPSSTATMSGMSDMSGMSSMSGMPNSMFSSMPMPTTLSPKGCTPPMMFKSGYNMSSLPIQTCSNTTSSLLTIPADPMLGWLALNLVNSASVTQMTVSLDGHSMFVYAADGLYVELQEVKLLTIAIGQRYSIMIKLDQPSKDYYLRFASYPMGDMQQVLEGQAIVSYQMHSSPSAPVVRRREISSDPSNNYMLFNGSASQSSLSILDPSALHPFNASSDAPPTGPADITKILSISQTDTTIWVLDKAPYLEAQIPVIAGTSSDGWMANTTIHVPGGKVVDLVMAISNSSMDMMGHPMHLHGHKFWVLGSGTGSFPYATVDQAPSGTINLKDPVLRDTAELPPAGWLAIRYKSDNPGAWLFHCHVQWHQLSGMALVFVEAEDKLPSIAQTNLTMTTTTSSTTIGATASSAAIRSSRGYLASWLEVIGHGMLVCLVGGVGKLLH